MNRFHMQRNGLMVEHHYRETLESIRRADIRFKGARIKNVLQLYPSRVQVGIVYDINKGEVKP